MVDGGKINKKYAFQHSQMLFALVNYPLRITTQIERLQFKQATLLPHKSNSSTEVMVTTRGQKLAENSTANVGKAEEEIAHSPSNKKLPVRAKQDKKPIGKTNVVVEIPVVKMTPIPGTQEEAEDNMFAEGRSHTKEAPKTKQEDKVDLTTEEVEEAEEVPTLPKEPKSKIEDLKVEAGAEVPNTFQGKVDSPIEIQDTQESDDESVVEVTKEEATPKKNLTAQAKPSKQSQVPSSKAPGITSAKPKHKRFGSEELELEPEIFSTARQTVESEDEESSDDDMVEEITAQDASRIASAKARDAAKAIEE